jgi:hypothetical protein
MFSSVPRRHTANTAAGPLVKVLTGYFPAFGIMIFQNFSVLMNQKAITMYCHGRSNRDWDFLINSLAGSSYTVKIVCDELHRDNLPSNIEIHNNVWKKESYSS